MSGSAAQKPWAANHDLPELGRRIVRAGINDQAFTLLLAIDFQRQFQPLTFRIIDSAPAWYLISAEKYLFGREKCAGVLDEVLRVHATPLGWAHISPDGIASAIPAPTECDWALPPLARPVYRIYVR